MMISSPSISGASAQLATTPTTTRAHSVHAATAALQNVQNVQNVQNASETRRVPFRENLAISIVAREAATGRLPHVDLHTLVALGRTCQAARQQVESLMHRFQLSKTACSEQEFRRCIGEPGTAGHRATGLRAIPQQLRRGMIINLCHRMNACVTDMVSQRSTEPLEYIDRINRRQEFEARTSLCNLVTHVISTLQIPEGDHLLSQIDLLARQPSPYLQLENNDLDAGSRGRLCNTVCSVLTDNPSMVPEERETLLARYELDQTGRFRSEYLNSVVTDLQYQPTQDYLPQLSHILTHRYCISNNEVALMHLRVLNGVARNRIAESRRDTLHLWTMLCR